MADSAPSERRTTAFGMFPFAIPEEAVAHGAAALIVSGVVPHVDLAKSSDDLARDVIEAALPFLKFSPNGDNHHNAAACPYCSASRTEDLAREREKGRQSGIHEAMERLR